MKKVVTHFHGKSPVTDFIPNVKTYSLPEISESFIDDAGDVIHILTNGNQLSENNYIKHWGVPKGKINLKAKDKGMDSRTNWIK